MPSTMSLGKPVRGEHLAEPPEQECDPVSNILITCGQLLFARHGLQDTRCLPRW